MPKFARPLEQACVSNKNDKQTLSKPPFLHLSDLVFHSFMVFCAHYYAKDNLPKGETCSKFDHPLEQAFISKRKLSKTPSLHLSKRSRFWLCRLGHTALLTSWVCSSGASFHTQTKHKFEALKNVFLTLVRPHFSWFLPVFYAHCPSKPLNAGEQNKPQKLPPLQVKCNFLKVNTL